MLNKKENCIIDLIFLFIAGVINAVGITLLLAPVGLIDSGFSGTSMLLGKFTVLSLPIFLLILNIPMFLYGMKKLGLRFSIYSVFTVCVYSGVSYLIYKTAAFSGVSPLAGDDMILCAVFGGMISGIGSGLAIRFGATMDGTEVMAVIFAKRLGISVGTFRMIYDIILFIAAAIMTKQWQVALYSIIADFVSSKAVDFIVEGLDRGKAATIITAKPEKIASALSDAFGKGITLMEGHGYYSSESKTIIYFVVNRFQIGKLKEIVRENDSDAFVAISEVSDIMRIA